MSAPEKQTPGSDAVEPADVIAAFQAVAAQLDRYPIEAFHFVHEGLGFAVKRTHGNESLESEKEGDVSRHITGRQLSEGLREYALQRWGLMARLVLARWNIHATLDFGRIVFAMIDGGLLAKTDDDTVDDFRDVFNFARGFDAGYQINADLSVVRSEKRA